MPRRDARRASRVILVVDDSPLFRELESLFLARSGEVVTASDGDLALALARARRPAVAVVDICMPGLGGDALCRAMKEEPELRDIPVVLVIDGDRTEERERAVRAGADDIITKPLNRQSLIQAVNRCLRSPDLPGLTRVPLETEVCMRDDATQEAWGTARNLSRGGMFVQVSKPLPPETEIQLRFALPDAHAPDLAPTAKVVWSRGRGGGAPPGMGLQFLKLDRDSAERIDDFVYQNTAPTRNSRS